MTHPVNSEIEWARLPISRGPYKYYHRLVTNEVNDGSKHSLKKKKLIRSAEKISNGRLTILSDGNSWLNSLISLNDSDSWLAASMATIRQKKNASIH